MRLDHLQKLTVEASNPKGVDPEKINPLIKKLRTSLEALRLQEHFEDLSGRIVDIDEFRFEQVSPNLLMIYWDVCKWDMVNRASDRIHDSARAKAAQLVKTVEIQENGTLIKVIDVR